MFVEQGHTKGEATAQERRDLTQPDDRLLGRVVRCDGSRATIAASADPTGHVGPATWAVGRLISINLGDVRTVGLVYTVETTSTSWHGDEPNPILVHVELVGEVRDVRETRKLQFDRGITVYPYLGAESHRIRVRDLAAVYDLGGPTVVRIGSLSQDDAIEARISMSQTLSRHFAVVGTTGVGKSTAVSLILHKAVETHPELRVLILDPHNEFASAFPDLAITIDTGTLDLPFWVFRLEELAEVLFRGRESVAEELDALRDMIPLAKMEYRQPGATGRLRRSGDTSITADSPLPYRMADLLRLIDERIGMLDGKQDRPHYRSLRNRIEAAIADPRYRFMFASRLIEDTIHAAIGKIFRIPHGGRPVTCFQMAGMPSEVVNSVCSVLARMAFDLAQLSENRLKLLVLCEEAHRYMPSDPKLGFAPTRHALARIAKEGRKYGCYLGVVTQRPGELDPTILSQCSTIFAMRLANEADQDIIRSAISDSSASTLSFLSSMGQREAIAFGDGVATPMRIKFERVGPELIPGSPSLQFEEASAAGEIDLVAIVERLRFGSAASTRGQWASEDEAAFPQRDAVPVLSQRPSLARPPVEAEPPISTPERRLSEMRRLGDFNRR